MAKALNPHAAASILALVLSLGARSAAACIDGGLAGHQIINDGAVAVLEASLCSSPSIVASMDLVVPRQEIEVCPDVLPLVHRLRGAVVDTSRDVLTNLCLPLLALGVGLESSVPRCLVPLLSKLCDRRHLSGIC